MNAAATSYDGQNKYLRITDIDESSRSFTPKPLTSPDGLIEDKYRLSEGDLVFARTGASVGKSYLYNKSDGNLYFAGFLIRFTILNENPYFIYAQTLKESFNKWVQLMSMRSGQPGINAEEYKTLPIFLPSFPEQTKIASFLTAVDEKLIQLKKKKPLLEQYKKGIMQKLFSQELRFKDNNNQDFPDWQEKTLSEILVEHKTRNKNKDIQEVFSVAKKEGVVNQIDHLGRSYASSDTSNYKVVFPYDIIYTKSPTSDFPYGIIKQNKLKRTGIVSVLYGVFTPKSEIVGLLLDYYFLNWKNTFNYLNPLVQKGAKNTMNVNNEVFLNGSYIQLPKSNIEQQKIANFLSSIDEKISHSSAQIDKMESWKKGLLQQMFC